MIDIKKYEAITEKIIASAFEVHKHLGNGFLEVVYQRAMEVEMSLHNLSFRREEEMTIYYKGNEVGKRRVDFLVNGNKLVELKAISEINNIHFVQVINYLEAYKLEIALLLNFGEKSLKIKRFLNSGLAKSN